MLIKVARFIEVCPEFVAPLSCWRPRRPLLGLMVKTAALNIGITSNVRLTFFFHTFSNRKLMCLLNSRHHFSLFESHVLRRTSGLAKIVVRFTDSEMYLLAKNFRLAQKNIECNSVSYNTDRTSNLSISLEISV